MSSEATQQLVDEVSKIVHRLTGIQMGSTQANMVKHRLQRRMMDLELEDSSEYLNFLKSHLDSESDVLVSLITTHHTYFFREFAHFEFLETKAIKRAVEIARSEGRKSIKIWSAACSRGQEVYSLSMFLKHHLKQIAPDMDYEILGTDVDQESVKISRNAVYRWNEVKEAPSTYLLDSWARGTGDIADYVKAKPSIKSKVKFEVNNLIEPSKALASLKFDIIFCRNVFIYFNQQQISQITKYLMSHLNPSGAFIIGLSESLHGLDLDVDSIGPSIYTQKGNAKFYSGNFKESADPVTKIATAPTPAELVRVLCVDDSPIILTILKKMLTKDRGFDIVATAKNGLEATKMLAKHKVDLMTLDIHMPEQDGLQYLAQNFSPSHPPVVIVSSVSREDQVTGIKALELGASDFVEKPSLESLASRTAEICAKLKSAVKNKSQSIPTAGKTEIERSFAQPLSQSSTQNRLRIVCMGSGDIYKLNRFISQWSKPQAPMLILLNAKEDQLAQIAQRIVHGSFDKPQVVSDWQSNFQENKIYVGSTDVLVAKGRSLGFQQYANLIVLGEPPIAIKDLYKFFGKKSMILEEPKKEQSTLFENFAKLASYVVPHTSIPYHSEDLLKGAK